MSRQAVVSAVMAELTKSAHLYSHSGVGGERGEWADQFKETPFYMEALEIQKDDALADVERAHEDAARDMAFAQRAMFRVRVAEMEAKLQEYKYQQMGLGAQAGGSLPEEAMAQPPSAPPSPAGPPTAAGPSAVLPPKTASAMRYLRLAESSSAPDAVVEAAKKKFLSRAGRYKKSATDNYPGGANLHSRKLHPEVTEYAKRVSGGAPAPKKLMISDREDAPEAWLAREAHAVGFLPEKKASISEYRQLTQKVASGAFGTEAQAALQGILSSRSASNTQTKVASGCGPLENENESNARQRRLAELLQKREPTGTDGGSASPNPSRDAT